MRKATCTPLIYSLAVDTSFMYTVIDIRHGTVPCLISMTQYSTSFSGVHSHQRRLDSLVVLATVVVPGMLLFFCIVIYAILIDKGYMQIANVC